MGATGARLTSSARLAPAVAAVRSAVRADLADLEPGALVLVACSGGPDSVALAAATAFVAPRAGLRVGAVVVDHGWSPGSAEVADRAAAACRGLALAPVEVVRVDCVGAGGPEAAARAARYAALDDAADRHGAAVVLLGHTREDQAETVLLGLARGSGTRSLAGMPGHRGRYRRPLLAVPRAVTREACTDLGLTTWDDPANDDPAYRRSRVRALLPALEEALGSGLVAALARSADLAREDADALDAAAADLLERALPRDSSARPVVIMQSATRSDVSGDRASRGGLHDHDELALEVAVLVAAPDAVRRRALRAAALRAGCPAGDLARGHVLAMDALITRWHGQGRVDLPGGVGAARDCGRLVLVAPAVRPARSDADRE